MGYSNRTFCCPFFRWDERLRVHGECGRLTMPDRDATVAFQERYCASQQGWQDCSAAKVLLHYYDRTERTDG